MLSPTVFQILAISLMYTHQIIVTISIYISQDNEDKC